MNSLTDIVAVMTGGALGIGKATCKVFAEEGAKVAITDIKDEFGKIDVLVNNAGISGVNKLTDEITEEEWDKLMDINVKGVFFCTKHVVPIMKENNGGSVINLSSIYGIIGAVDLPPYHASKG